MKVFRRITGVLYTDMMGPDLQVTPKYSLCVRQQVWVCVCGGERERERERERETEIRMDCRWENRKI